MFASLKKDDIKGIYDSPKIHTTAIRQINQEKSNMKVVKKVSFSPKISLTELKYGRLSYLSTAANSNTPSCKHNSKGIRYFRYKEGIFDDNNVSDETTSYCLSDHNVMTTKKKKKPSSDNLYNKLSCTDLFKRIKTTIKDKLECSFKKSKIESKILKRKIQSLNEHLRCFSNENSQLRIKKTEYFSSSKKNQSIAYRVKRENKHMTKEIAELKKEIAKMEIQKKNLIQQAKDYRKQFYSMSEEVLKEKKTSIELSNRVSNSIEEKKNIISNIMSFSNKIKKQTEIMVSVLGKENIMKSHLKLILENFSDE